MSTWINEVLEEVSYVETPKNWLWWSALAAISAVAAPNVYLNKEGAYELKPNLYILLIGRSGLGKGFGISLSKKLVREVSNTRIISGKATIEGIIKELSIVKAGENGHLPFKDARGFITSGEFAASMHDSMSMLTTLTDLYDAHDNPDWKNTLKHSSGEILRFPCITLLSGANQDMFDLAVSGQHKAGGFVGRTLLISATKRDHSNSLIEDRPNVDIVKLSGHLKRLAKLEGKIRWSKEAKIVFNEWFYPFRDADLEDKTGTYDRLHDHVLKVAMCISLARKTDMILEVEDIEEAIDACSNLSGTAKKVAGLQGKSSAANAMKPFLVIMFSAPEYTLSRKQVLQKGFGEFDSYELDKIVETLFQTGFVIQKTGGKDIVYQVTKVGIDWWESKTGKK